ncbi:MAG TPA: WecB/TagA/CpsF family glycosyltransferase [Burkholderiales bacterium]|nr:WecB/TagA/CpsF family glycosyltransferase [Burkholderiales bacterium]
MRRDFLDTAAGTEALPRREVLGISVASLSREAATLLLEQKILEGIPARVAFANANLVNMACEDEALRERLANFLVLNDGVGLNIASRYLHGEPFPDNLNGTDFIPFFLDNCGSPLRIFLLGGRPEVAANAAAIVARRWPRHSVAGHQHGYFASDEGDRVFERIRAASPDVVLVAMGNGPQERWVERLVPHAAMSAFGVGALFDFLTGEVARAPAWMRGIGLEWGFRLVQEPRRLFRRYLVGNPKFILRVLLARHRNRYANL